VLIALQIWSEFWQKSGDFNSVNKFWGGRGQYYRLACLYEVLPHFEIKLRVVDFLGAGHVLYFMKKIYNYFAIETLH